MPLFSKKSKDENQNLKRLLALDGKGVDYVIKKNRNTYEERIIGRKGCINISNNMLIIKCEGTVAFEMPLESLTVGELLSLNGVTLTYDEDTLIIAYYSYYRK